jgi:hypothetical protein
MTKSNTYALLAKLKEYVRKSARLKTENLVKNRALELITHLTFSYVFISMIRSL